MVLLGVVVCMCMWLWVDQCVLLVYKTILFRVVVCTYVCVCLWVCVTCVNMCMVFVCVCVCVCVCVYVVCVCGVCVCMWCVYIMVCVCSLVCEPVLLRMYVYMRATACENACMWEWVLVNVSMYDYVRTCECVFVCIIRMYACNLAKRHNLECGGVACIALHCWHFSTNIVYKHAKNISIVL